MTPADLRAKATDLIMEYGIAQVANTRNFDKYTREALDESRADLTAFVEAMIECHEAFVVGVDPGCPCSRCKKMRAALSRLEELAK